MQHLLLMNSRDYSTITWQSLYHSKTGSPWYGYLRILKGSMTVYKGTFPRFIENQKDHIIPKVSLVSSKLVHFWSVFLATIWYMHRSYLELFQFLWFQFGEVDAVLKTTKIYPIHRARWDPCIQHAYPNISKIHQKIPKIQSLQFGLHKITSS